MPPDKTRPFVPRPYPRRLAAAVALVSGLFVLTVAILMIANYAQIRAMDPIDLPELQELRRQLADSLEEDPALVQRIRALDLLARKAYFTSLEHLRMGARLLLGGAIVFLVALKLASRWAPRPPQPSEPTPAEEHWLELSLTRESIALFSVSVVVLALLAAYFTPLDLPDPGAFAPTTADQAPAAAPAAAPVFPDWEEMKTQWPSFRGPGGLGVAHFDTAPSDWDGASGRNIRWRAEVPLPGTSSPVVWDDRVYLSGATTEVREVYCFDANTGELRWRQTLPVFPGTPTTPPRIMEETGFAAPTMAVHGDLAFALFGNGDLACYDASGTLRWGKNLGVPDNHYGHSSSLIAWEGLLLVQYDDRDDPRLLALCINTGEQVWRVQRSRISWASPICVPLPTGPQLILASEQDVDAYDPRTGNVLWSVNCLDGEVAPSPAWAAGHVFVANEYATSAAIRLAFTDSGTTAAVAWEWDEALPDVASPVGSDCCFFIATSRGELVSLDIASGEQRWLHEFDEGFYASPILVGNRLYALDREGTMQICRVDGAFELLGSPSVGEETVATPAFLDRRIYLRTQSALICIEEPQ